MKNIDFIKLLEDFAAAKGYKFIFGFDNFYRNIETDLQLTPNEIVLIGDVRITPTIKNGQIHKLRYESLLMLGRKFESATNASLEENIKQKYENRLSFLADELIAVLTQISCENDFEVVNSPINFAINQFDANIDFAVCNNAVFETA